MLEGNFAGDLMEIIIDCGLSEYIGKDSHICFSNCYLLTTNLTFKVYQVNLMWRNSKECGLEVNT